MQSELENTMLYTRFFVAGAALLALAMSAAPVMAYEEISNDLSKGEAGGFIGLGATYAPDYEGGDDYEAYIAAFGNYRRASGRYISLGGTSGTEKAARVRVNFIAKDQSSILEFGPLLQYRLKRDRDSVDNNKVQKMNEIDAAIEAGAFIGLDSGPWSASVSYAHDVTSVYKGDLWYINGGYGIQVNDGFDLKLGAHLTWASRKFMDDYFGVSGSESAKTGLPKYSADGGFKDAGIGLTGHYMFNQDWGLLGNVSYTRMLNDAEDSPLVEKVGDKNQYAAVLAVTYSF
jgi:outer membrane scaffolding protein for murein synthesis (MipA/OmpV family)